MSVFLSIKELLDKSEEKEMPLWRYVQQSSAREAGISERHSFKLMEDRLQAMRAADEGYDPKARSRSGLIGGDAQRLKLYAEKGNTLCGEFIDSVLAAALRMGECNACMHRIVAAPTAGSCGVLPAVLLPYAKKHGTEDERLIQALYVAAGFGAVIATRASIAGAEAGCQAEIGTAAAMAAASLVFLHGGDNMQMANAAAIALKNMMGLACDPVAGLVEIPCVKRNAAGAMNAMCAAELALAGIGSRIPCDEVIDAMAEVGELMSLDLKETGRGGIAASPTAVKFREQFFGK